MKLIKRLEEIEQIEEFSKGCNCVNCDIIRAEKHGILLSLGDVREVIDKLVVLEAGHLKWKGDYNGNVLLHNLKDLLKQSEKFK